MIPRGQIILTSSPFLVKCFRMEKVLLLYVFERSGHHLAALAIDKAIGELRGETLTVNFLNHTNTHLNQVVQKSYLSLLHNTPEIWDYLYDNLRVARKISKVRKFINKLNSGKLEELIESFSPEAVLCTQAFPCGVVAAYKEKKNKNLPLIGVVTDYIAHCYWLYDQVDIYVVPHETTQQDLMNKGIEKGRIRITGIPIAPRFARKENKDEIRERTNLNPHLPTILIMGGSQGLGPVEEIVSNLDALPLSFQMIVITGLNKELRRDLEKREERLTKPIRILEYIDNVEELMEISDIIITKPGGLTTAEALVKGLAIVIAGCLPGQEERNSRFLVDAGVAIRAEGGKGVAAAVDELLSNPCRLSSLQAKARELSRPEASADIAKIILEVVS